MKLYVDFDGVISNSIKTIVQLYNEDYMFYDDYEYVDWTEIKTYDFSELTYMTKELLNNYYFNTSRFFTNLKPMRDAEYYLKCLSDFFNIVVVSMGQTPNLAQKELWINEHMPYAKFIGLDIYKHKDKSCIDMSDGIIIDDNDKMLLNNNAQLSILFGKRFAWNEKFTGTHILSWEALYSYLINYYS